MIRNHKDRPDRDNITCMIKINAPSFDGKHDPHVFSNRLTGMNNFFGQHETSEVCIVHFAKMKLVRSV